MAMREAMNVFNLFLVVILSSCASVVLSQPANDDCENAVMLPVGSSSNGTQAATVGTLVDATSSSYCGNAPLVGVWYEVVGTGGELEVTTCHEESGTFGTRLFVHSDGCNGTTCVDDITGNLLYTNCADGSLTGWTFVWESLVDVTYSVYVTALNPQVDPAEFGISVQERPPPPPANVPINDECSAAIELAFDATEETVGTNVDATDGDICNVDVAVPVPLPGVYYQVTGNGGNVTVTTCSASTDFATVISIQDGGCDGGCISPTELESLNRCEDDAFQGATVTWTSVDGVQYIVLVSGLGSSGNFGIRATSTVVVDANDEPTASPIAGGTFQPTPTAVDGTAAPTQESQPTQRSSAMPTKSTSSTTMLLMMTVTSMMFAPDMPQLL